jgi:hypothetical protein
MIIWYPAQPMPNLYRLFAIFGSRHVCHTDYKSDDYGR